MSFMEHSLLMNFVCYLIHGQALQIPVEVILGPEAGRDSVLIVYEEGKVEVVLKVHVVPF